MGSDETQTNAFNLQLGLQFLILLLLKDLSPFHIKPQPSVISIELQLNIDLLLGLEELQALLDHILFNIVDRK